MKRERRDYAKKSLKNWLDWFNGDKKYAAKYTSIKLNLPNPTDTSEQYKSFNIYLGKVCERWASIYSK